MLCFQHVGWAEADMTRKHFDLCMADLGSDMLSVQPT